LLVAEEEAEYLRHRRIGVEDLLVGLAAAGIGRAAEVLAGSGVEPAPLRAAIGRSPRAGPAGTGLELDDAALRALGLMDDERVAEAAGPLAPAVVYLRQADVAAALRRVSDQRGPGWVAYQVNWKLASPYAERRGLAGYEGLVRLYQEYVAVCLELLDHLDLPKLVVERDGDWRRAREAVRAFLRLEAATA
jgi:hypothetical protein